MGLFDRITSTLDGLSRDDDERVAGDEIDLALGFADRGDLATAEERLRAVTRKFPRLGRGFARLGEVLARRGADDDAAGAYGRAVDLDPDDIHAWFDLGELLARLDRFEPARDALRRALTRALDPAERGRAHAALGRLYARHGALGKAVRELGKAVRLLASDPALAADYGRALVSSGDPGAAEWLTHAALAPGADPRLIVDAAAATEAPAAAERLLRDALARTPHEITVRAALARHLTRAGRVDEGRALALAAVDAAPGDVQALRALRENFAAEGRWGEALEAARREAELGAAVPVRARLALALGARDRTALAELAAAAAGDDQADRQGDAAVLRALGRFLAHDADEADLTELAVYAPDAASRRFVVEGLAPAPVPAGNLVALLGYAHAMAARTPELWAQALPAARALEAFDRPLLIAIMGEFNAGKSSFVNALCGEEIAPVGVTPTTATINILRYGARGGRAIYHDGRARELEASAVAPFLRGLGAEEAGAIRVVEIFHPLDVLRRVEIVDTPGLNSLRPEHESVARDFLIEADAIVWLFAVGQAAKATEKEALRLARAAGKRVLGVLNKIDRASSEEIAQVSAHVARSLGDLVEAIVPFSARQGLAARRGRDRKMERMTDRETEPKPSQPGGGQGGAPGDDGGLGALEQALEQRFFQHARALKRTTALGALRRFVADASAATAGDAGAGAAGAPAHDFAGERRALQACEQRARSALAGERVGLRARIDEAYRNAAFEVREFVRPRSWLFGEHRAEAADEEFLVDLLDEAIGRAVEQTRAALDAAVHGGPAEPPAAPPPPGMTDAIARACDRAVERFRAYARGVLEGGAVAEFFRQDLPRIRLDLAAIRRALARRAPDPEEIFFRALDRELGQIVRRAALDIDHAEAVAVIATLIRRERVERPLEEIAQAVASLSQPAAGAD